MVNVGDDEFGEKVDNVGEVETAMEVVSLLILIHNFSEKCTSLIVSGSRLGSSPFMCFWLFVSLHSSVV